MGSTDFYEALMPARELVTGVRPASELDEWTTMSIEERIQRDPNLKRVENEIAPYIAQSADRFFGSVIVLVYKGEVYFESITEIADAIPMAYRGAASDLGFLTIDGGSLIVLDGQHRLLALEKVIKNQVSGPFAKDVPNDDVSVIFITHESNDKTRRIFNKVNRYAKPTSRGENIITSEDDGYAIITRRLLDEGAPLGLKDERGEVAVNWRSNTISAGSNKLTTMSALYEIVKLILDREGVERLDERKRPTDDELLHYYEIVEGYWRAVLDGLQPYQQALADTRSIHEMRRDTQPFSLLFKPAAQIALFDALLTAKDRGLSFAEAVERANRVDWRMSSPTWQDVIVRSSGVIDPKAEARDRAARLIAYLISADKMTDREAAEVRRIFNLARGRRPDDGTVMLELPEPVVGARQEASSRAPR